MEKYNPQKIEKKWQKYWSEHPELDAASETSPKEKKFILDMFPYPSGDGLHVGHVESYTATDIVSRYYRFKGYNVLHPQGWDAFGLPAENFAIKKGVHPDVSTHQNIKNFTRQIKSMGFSYDWSRELDTSSPEYYRWTQWFFLLLYKNGFAYKKKAKANWCPKCQTVLANEQAEGGICDRCQTEVVQKDLEQWFFKITDFVENNGNTAGLISGLEKVDWPESIKASQKNWIGRSEGVQFSMQIKNSPEKIEVYTTRIDTVFGMTYVVVAPEHASLNKLKDRIENYGEVEKYRIASQNKTDLERMETKDKNGVEIQGVRVINPFTKEELPLFVADYVLGHYGTGAVMAVPAHDERDFEFAKKYNLNIKKSVDSDRTYVVAIKKSLEDEFYNEVRKIFQTVERDGLVHIYSEKVDDIFDLAEKYFIGGSWYIHSEGPVKKILFHSESGNKRFDRTSNDQNQEAHSYGLGVGIKEEQLDWDAAYEATTEDGILINSEEYNGLTSEEARKKMAVWLEQEGIGSRKVNYRIRDWLVSRQRYWGAPIPIIYCDKCGEVSVPESDLPVMLPTDVDFKPTGESPLAYSEKFQTVACPRCGAKARRESDTMDTFVCSSWYYFRYSDPKNSDSFASEAAIKKWLPVDLYVGGAEHAVLHLLYARFFTKVLHKLGMINFDEPFLKLRNQGIILAEDGRKMSKSLGNVVNPDQVVNELGADTLRLFEMFMGPLEDMKPWQTKGIVGLVRFLEKIWRQSSKVTAIEAKSWSAYPSLQKSIQKVSADIEGLRFNTAISQLMILLNEIDKSNEIPKKSYEQLLIILAPFVPHIAEELWEKSGATGSIFSGGNIWPEADASALAVGEINLAVQINGKTRGTIHVSPDIDESSAKENVLADEKLQKYLAGKDIRKIIFVKGRLINLVVS